MRVVACAGLVGGVAFTPRPAVAQGRTAGGVRPFVGAGFGMGALPNAFRDCGGGATVMGPELRAGVRLGAAWSVISRANVALDFSGNGCLIPIIPSRPDGTYTVRRFARDMSAIGVATADLRLAYSLPSWPYMRAAAGAGWAWDERQVPFLVGGLGARGAGRWAPYVEAEGWFFRVPVVVEEETVLGGSWLGARVIAREHDWVRMFGVRAGVELTL